MIWLLYVRLFDVFSTGSLLSVVCSSGCTLAVVHVSQLPCLVSDARLKPMASRMFVAIEYLEYRNNNAILKSCSLLMGKKLLRDGRGFMNLKAG